MSVPEHVRLYLDPKHWRVTVGKWGAMWRVTFYRRNGCVPGGQQIVSDVDFEVNRAISKCFNWLKRHNPEYTFGTNFDLEWAYKHPQYVR